MKQHRTFGQYLRQNHLWATISVVVISLTIGITALVEGFPLMSLFMLGIIITLFAGSYDDWKKRG